MERDDLASLAGFFFADAALASGSTITLGEVAAHHARVRRLDVGDRVYVADGAGTRAIGSIVRATKRAIAIAIDEITHTARTAGVHLLVPIADRDHMLWCAEKITELGATSWRPIRWHRSRSVSPRGEGAAFREKVLLRMRAALIQAHAPWLPDVAEDATVDLALEALPGTGTRLVLDTSGEPIAGVRLDPPLSIAVGPEGGLEPVELDRLVAARFRAVSLGANVLRFETAAVAALAIARSALDVSSESANG